MKAETNRWLERGICCAALVLGIGFKAWLLQESEIIDDYHDPSEYVLQILHPLNGGLAYGQGTGRFARIFYDLNIPYRWGIEIAFMGACLLALKALFDWPGRTYLATGLFLFILFDPTLMEQLSQMYSDQIWLLETLIGFTLLVFAVGRTKSVRWPYLIPAVIALSYSTITRSVFFPLMAALVLFTCGTLLVGLVHGKKTVIGQNSAVFLLVMWTLILVVASFYEGTCLYDQKKFGFSGISAVDSSEYKNLFLCLQSVGDPTGVPNCAIDKNRRALIAQAGPNARWLMNRLDEDHEDNQAGWDKYGIYDIPSGQFDWAVFHTVMPVCQGDFRQTFAFFRVVEGEVAEAARRGVFRIRFVLPLPDTRLGVVARLYPASLQKTLGALLYEPPAGSFFNSQDPAHFQYKDFDRALHRRPVHNSPIRNRIWAVLSAVYACIYTPSVLALCLVILLVHSLLVIWRTEALAGRLPAVMQHLFIVMFFVLLAWYSLFVASGVLPLSRYLIYNHVLLFPLTAFALLQTVRLRPRA